MTNPFGAVPGSIPITARGISLEMQIEESPMHRREFMKSAAAAASIAAMASMLPAEETTPASNGMIYRKLGRTGQRVSAIGLGGYHLGQKGLDESESIRLMHQAIDRGI